MEESFPLGEIREKKTISLHSLDFEKKQLGVTFPHEIKKKKKIFWKTKYVLHHRLQCYFQGDINKKLIFFQNFHGQ